MREFAFVQNSAGRTVPTEANGKAQNPYQGVAGFHPEGPKAAPPVRSCRVYPAEGPFLYLNFGAPRSGMCTLDPARRYVFNVVFDDPSVLRKEAGSIGAGGQRRTYERHWTPVHLDVVVNDVDAAVRRAVRAGAVLEQDVRINVWGKIAMLADPFGHGFCLIQFLNRGYDEIAE